MSIRKKFQELKKNHPFVLLFLFVYLGFLILYIVIFQFFYADYSKPMPLNEIGDFLAGVFSPLAFLFLYLGYRQQSLEIQKNTNELKEQKRQLLLQSQPLFHFKNFKSEARPFLKKIRFLYLSN